MARSHEPPKGTWMPNSPDKPSAMKQLQSLSIFDQFPSWEVQTKAPKKASLVCKDLVQFNFEWGTSPLRLIEQFTMKPKCTDLQQRNVSTNIGFTNRKTPKHHALCVQMGFQIIFIFYQETFKKSLDDQVYTCSIKWR
mmetsp:Transcript_20032/g.22292  ORF Transcript_20032/g.22292 Transcript_20032/m.22292 type:complete len:138 (+) Transcript_20032:374-787(+)